MLRAMVNPEARHHALVILSVMLAVVLTAAMAVYGWHYYTLDLSQRPFSPLHAKLKPSGTVGLKLGMLGLFLFSLVYLYPLRKRWLWLARQGKAKHWLDFHMLLGLAAPAAISFHSSFKMQGFAGMAYWTMVGLVLSGIVGRYFYAQIPRTLDAATMSLKESQEVRSLLIEELGSQTIFAAVEIAGLFPLPDVERVRQMSIPRALCEMIALDLARPFRVWALRRRKEGALGKILTLGGILPTRHRDLEMAIQLVCRHASLAKKVLFLSTTERVFYLWHVVHRPFSFSFAVFVVIHVAVVMSLGFF
jgi:TRAP-type C4-dicarboxylate transport system permease small subunit